MRYTVNISLLLDDEPISMVTCKSLKEARAFLDGVEEATEIMKTTLKKVYNHGLVNVDN